MELRVLFFARGRELAGTPECAMQLPEGSTTTHLMEALLQQVEQQQQCIAAAVQCGLAGWDAAQRRRRPALTPLRPPGPPQFPSLQQLHGTFVFSLNQEYLAPGEEVALKSGDEVAIIPPISGG